MMDSKLSYSLRHELPNTQRLLDGEARRKRNWNAFNQVLRDRRTDIYDEMLGSETRPGWY